MRSHCVTENIDITDLVSRTFAKVELSGFSLSGSISRCVTDCIGENRERERERERKTPGVSVSRGEKVGNKMQIGCKSGQTRGTDVGPFHDDNSSVSSTKREATLHHRGLIVFGANRYPDPIEAQVLVLP